MAIIGKRLDRYAILREIGRGSMGQVYLARDTRLGRNVAIKMLPPEVASDVARRRRFARESQALAALNHPGMRVPGDPREVGLDTLSWVRPLAELGCYFLEAARRSSVSGPLLTTVEQ